DEDRKKRRKLLMQGLVPVMKQEECEAVAKWEKERNIKKVRKHKVDTRDENAKKVESQRRSKKASNEK
ncbi:1528_t:CDS:2, partial [Gigaspora rosea]